jgi:RHS repeat-associated protein
VGQWWGYTGQRWEAGIGLYDYNARYYDPALGRFVQADTIVPSVAHSQDFNRYSYVRGNPMIYVDPTGHTPGLPFLVLAGLLVAGIAEVGYLLVGRRVMKKQLMPVYNNSNSDAEFLVNVFRSDQVRGETARKRLSWFRLGTSEFPTGNMRGDFKDTGFQPIFQDGGDQVGHFMTAVNFGYISVGADPAKSWYVRLAVGHEIVGDNVAGSVFKQILAGDKEARSLFASAINADVAGNYSERDDLLKQILALGGDFDKVDRTGNSIADLILTIRGLRFGQMIACGEITTREQAALWLEKYVQSHPTSEGN